MKKRAIALVVLMAMVIGMTSQMVSATEPATFHVGYAKVDINPYVDGRWLQVPMAGGSETTTRLSLSKADDNGNGQIDADDGIFATCIAITDQHGNTVLLISCDLNNTYDAYLTPARQKIAQTYAEYNVTADSIFVNASHNHSGPMLVAGWESGYDFSPDLKLYREHLVSQLVKVVGDALEDRSPATMHKGSIDASENADDVVGNTFNALNPQNPVATFNASDRVYNTVRHYRITASGNDGSTYSYVCGDNLNKYYPVGATFYVDKVRYTVTKVASVTQADDRMQVVKFAFADGKQPIALINWRAHVAIAKGRGTVNGSDAYRQISGDYVNTLRYTLGQSGYRTAFFQGASGNINAGSQLPAGDWLRNTGAGQAENRHVIYGTELAEIALKCLNNNMFQINPDGGEIRNTQMNYQSARKQVSVLEYMAGCQYIRDEKENGNGVYTADTMYYYVDENGNPLIYTSGDNRGTRSAETGAKKIVAERPVVITSKFHANTMIDGYRDNAKAGVVLELNAITIGELSIVTAAGEPFDYYSNASKGNMWEDIGADFVLGYTNVGGGYLSSRECFYYNGENSTMAPGTYETMSQNISEGTGEAVVEHLGVMLDSLKERGLTDPTDRICSHCGKKADWIELSPEEQLQSTNTIQGGHYYLTRNITLNDIDAANSANICINLNGRTLNIKKGFIIPNGSVLSLMGDGVVAGDEGFDDGGVFTVKAGGTLNLYDATLRYVGACGSAGIYQDTEETKYGRTVRNGGVLQVEGTFNMYDGRIEGTNTYGSGGAVLVGKTGLANIRGGVITDKEPARGNNAGGKGDCIRNVGKVILSGDAKIDEVYINNETETDIPWGERLVFEGKYTGTVNIRYFKISDAISRDVGDCVNADISCADIKINNDYVYELRMNNGDLAVEMTAICAVEDKNNPGTFVYSNNPTAAIQNISAGSRVILNKDVNSFTVNKDLHLELKGKTVNSLTVEEGFTVQVSDCTTADYDISDNKYGNVKVISGTVVGTTDANTGDIYIPVKETGGYTSYHAVDLDIDEMGLKAEKLGLYFKHDFKGDAKVKEAVDYYGVALSAVGAPAEKDMQAAASQLGQNVHKNDTIVFTAFDGSGFGQQAATSVLVSGIMKTINGYLTNKNNAAMKIYGSAYIKLKDSDTFVFGTAQGRSLQEQVEGVDSQLWDTLTQAQKNALLKMYEVNAFRKIMDDWALANIPTQ